MSLPRLATVAFATATVVGSALACGPFFTWQLLDDRRATLLAAPSGLEFDFVAARLAPAPSDDLKVVEFKGPREAEARELERTEAASGVWDESADPSLTRGALLALQEAARSADNEREALAAGAGLPPAVLRYIAGAVAFRHFQYVEALGHFEAIDDLPAERRHIREVAAAYMQGRTHLRLGNLTAARSAFRRAHAQALAGAPDPTGLGVASLGEEARVDLIQATQNDADPAELTIAAVHLYAEQAAHGSEVALNSLQQVAVRLSGDTDLLAQVVDDEIVRRLLVSYVTAGDAQAERDDATTGPRDDAAQLVIAAVLNQTTAIAGDDIDRLAVLAYQTARYEAAERLAALSDSPIGHWVRAKLALQQGDRDEAIRELTAAISAMETLVESPARDRMRGELAIMRLAKSQYSEALRLLLPSERFWGDTAYVAERVLTIDELKTFVDGLSTDGNAQVQDLRYLLARRLVRQGHPAQAIPYFPAALPTYSGAPPFDVRKLAEAYSEATDNAQPTWRWRNVSRAEALFKLAVMTRWQNRELLATEGVPDGDLSVGQPSPRGQLQEDHLLGRDEWPRFFASGAGLQSSYRSIAAERAFQAAELLPHGSQAYAATLCWASRDAKLAGDPDRARSIYKLYVATGAYQPWAKAFGGTCPQPDFEAARYYWPKRIVREVRRHLALAASAGLAIALLLGVSFFVLRRRSSIRLVQSQG